MIAVALAWSLRESRRANAAEDLATSLQQRILERGILRDEYLLHREARAQAQWDVKSAQIGALLGQVATSFEASSEQQVLGEMTSLLDQSLTLFSGLVRMADDRTTDENQRGLSFAFRERVASKLLLLSHDLYGRAKRLASSAAARSKSAQRRTLVLTALMISAVLALTVANAMMTSRLVERRIVRLQDGAERIAGGMLAHRIGIAGDDELATLGRAFDSMAERLQESHATLDGEVAERRQAEERVKQLNDELSRYVARLEASNRELEAFSYSVSHDLRAPLRSVAGFSQAVLEDYGPQLDAKGREYLELACQGSREMGQLIDDLLALSRVARVEMAHERVDLSAIARALGDDLRKADPERRVELEIAPDLFAMGDPTLLRVVMDNLLRNAWKFTSTHPRATIAVGRAHTDGRDAFFVADDGVGFDMAYVDKLLHPFQRLHASHEFPGTGVGLATVNRIVRRHGGEVRAEGAVDKGATIWFTLAST